MEESTISLRPIRHRVDPSIVNIKESRIRFTLRVMYRKPRTSLEVYTGIKMELTTSASAILMSCRVLDGDFDSVSHHAGFAED